MSSLIQPTRSRQATVALGAALVLLAPAAVRADPTYKIQPVLKFGEAVADGTFKLANDMRVAALNDAGQLLYAASLGSGPLVQYSDGKHVPIAIRDGDAPGGKWPAGLEMDHVIDMNERGNVLFNARVLIGSTNVRSPLLWDAATKKVTATSLPEMPASSGLTFVTSTGTDISIPSINNRDDLLIRLKVKDAAGVIKPGIFVRDNTGKFTTVLIDGQAMPGGGTAITSGSLDLSDAGVAAFMGRRVGVDPNTSFSAFVWEQGVVTVVASNGQEIPGGEKILRALAIRVNDNDRSVLVAVALASNASRGVLYRFAEGKLHPVAIAGQEMPGGGKLQSVVVGSANTGPTSHWYLSRANSAGQVAFLARLEDGSRAIYRVDAAGQLSLLLKEGAMTELGAITRIAETFSVAYNAKGQLAAVLKFGDGPNTLALLTPSGP